ncbi:DUF2946 family protein [Massilia psychrophila]|jgi:hypothetical protein|uniref:DUF2946 domain-containing protein n=1 Tax=Massilia psychrophila TaxID=1603353 RepID=A0A2G8T6D6_9BURK|nr:DUF2946 family protein [Massilia psychrophila]PIL41627.1 hypothetical protein CR103_00865 [Massilia psychrophila]GGE61536.1 hypothetical protein GCM10008020_02130 [Massilia psychrophila]
MDDIVRRAMAKWPNVPDCYGWLALDARGAWRMRDERAQHLNRAGDKVTQPKLLDFINRNYAADERGCWYFQNGPQRVFVNLEAAPFIARTDPQQGLLLHTGAPFTNVERGFMTNMGELILEGTSKLAQVDDRDLAQLLVALQLDGKAAGDDALLAWLDGAPGKLCLPYLQQVVPLERVAAAHVPARFGFQRAPAP